MNHPILKGLLILSPTLLGMLIDWLFSTTAFLFVGAAFTVVESAERLLNRFGHWTTATCCPDKFAAYQNREIELEEKLEESNLKDPR